VDEVDAVGLGLAQQAAALQERDQHVRRLGRDAPVAIASLAVGPAVVAGVGLVGGLGAAKLSALINQALDALRRKGEERPTEAAVERELAARLESALSEVTESNAKLLAAATELLLAVDVLRGRVIDGVAELSVRFGEFDVLAVEIRTRISEFGEAQRDQAMRSDEQTDLLHRLLRIAERIDAGRHSRSQHIATLYGECPYLGLVAYSQANAKLFYGRTGATLRLQEKLLECAKLSEQSERSDQGGGGLLVVTGASGAGKSSLLRAGLIPALGRGAVRAATRDWTCRVFTPTDHPMRRLAGVLAALTGQAAQAEQVCADLMLDPQHAAVLAAQAVRRLSSAAAQSAGSEVGAARLVLVVDQFEELFTQVGAAAGGDGNGNGAGEQEKFIAALDALCAPAEQTAGQRANVAPALVVVAVRGDFIDRAADFPPLARALAAGPFVVEPMTESELRDAVVGPAGEAGLKVEPELVADLVAQARAQPQSASLAAGVLPLISQVMARVWTEREGKWLTVQGLRRVGGLADAVDRDVTEAYADLDEAAQLVARAVFLRLTLITEDGRLVRRRATKAELGRAAGVELVAVDAVTEVFAKRRLLVLLEEGEVEIAHDVLLQSWGLLQEWVDADRLDHARYSRLATDAAAWQENHADAGYLYAGARLTEYSEALERWHGDPERFPGPSAPVEQFLLAGRTAERRRVRRRRSVLASLTALSLLAMGVAGVAVQQYAQANSALRQSEYGQLLAPAQKYQSSDASLSARFALAAYKLDPTGAALVQLAQTDNTPLASAPLAGPKGGVTGVAYVDNGTVLAVGGPQAPLQLWSLTDPTEPVLLHSATIGSAHNGIERVAAAGSRLAVGLADGQVELWNLADPEHPTELGSPLSAGSGAVQGLSLSAAGTILGAGDADGTATVWSLADPVAPQQLWPSARTAATWRPAAATAASGSGACPTPRSTPRIPVAWAARAVQTVGSWPRSVPPPPAERWRCGRSPRIDPRRGNSTRRPSATATAWALRARSSATTATTSCPGAPRRASCGACATALRRNPSTFPVRPAPLPTSCSAPPLRCSWPSTAAATWGYGT
jgi:hypothetical protein